MVIQVDRQLMNPVSLQSVYALWKSVVEQQQPADSKPSWESLDSDASRPLPLSLMTTFLLENIGQSHRKLERTQSETVTVKPSPPIAVNTSSRRKESCFPHAVERVKGQLERADCSWISILWLRSPSSMKKPSLDKRHEVPETLIKNVINTNYAKNRDIVYWQGQWHSLCGPYQIGRVCWLSALALPLQILKVIPTWPARIVLGRCHVTVSGGCVLDEFGREPKRRQVIKEYGGPRPVYITEVAALSVVDWPTFGSTPRPCPWPMYKTELCRPYEESGTCKYGEKCQFAHGGHELRCLVRHPKYKTELCRTFHSVGFCPYGPRCHFIHNAEEARSGLSPRPSSSPTSSLASSPGYFSSPPHSPPPSPASPERLPVFNRISNTLLPMRFGSELIA
ncbi:unnamed protein product [Nezara viridula]|uniref:C3H1-type domain-containing protein n=1 Tax=Nezara viridula TaxID=85310 RepID=A0A9P0H130_NEZVI|nr:unnamed protein product [Nezara viridula]